jgi:membrane-bound serine protease (ClpP class)
VVELDTPGGEMELMFRLATQLADANHEGISTIAWIHDRAYSAGALVALSCEKIYMRTQGVIGAASVVQPSATGGIQSIEDPVVEAKVTAAVRSAFRAFAESHHRPPALAEAMVDRMVGAKQVRTKDGELRVLTAGEFDDQRNDVENVQLVHTIAERGSLVSLSGSEAVRFGLADGVADSLDDVLNMVGLSGAKLVTLERTRSEDLATWLSAVNYVLIGLGVMALVAEFKAPGFGFAGVVAILCFALALFGKYLVGLADVPHLVAVGAGCALVAVELFLLPGAIWPGVGGAVLILGGLAFAQFGSDFTSSPFGREMAVDSALELMAGIVVALGVGALISRFLPKTPLVGRLVQSPTAAYAGGAPAAEFTRAPQLGERGVAITPLRPVGKVSLASHSEAIEARSSGTAIDAGAHVRVVMVEGLRAVVELETESGA